MNKKFEDYVFETYKMYSKDIKEMIQDFTQEKFEKIFELLSENNMLQPISERFFPYGSPEKEDMKAATIKYFFEDNISTFSYDYTNDFLICPFCGKSHDYFEYLVPKEGKMENLLEKYSDKIDANIICDYFEDYYTKKNRNQTLFKMIVFENEEYLCEKKNNFRFEISADDFITNDNGICLVCPSCKKDMQSDKRHYAELFYQVENKREVKVLTRDYVKWKYQNVFCIGHKIYDDNNDKIVFALLYRHIFPNIKGKIHSEVSVIRHVFNTKTGQSYCFNPYNIDTHKPYYKEKTKLLNITNSAGCSKVSSSDITPDMMKEVADKICEKKGIKCFDEKDINILCKNYDICNNNILPAINRFAKLGTDFIFSFLVLNKGYFVEDVLSNYEKRIFYQLAEKDYGFKRFIKNKKIPKNKKILNIIAKNPCKIYLFKSLQEIGFLNIDIISNILNQPNEFTATLTYEIKKNKYRFGKDGFINKYIQLKGETELSLKIIKLLPNQISLIPDIDLCLNKIKSYIEVNDDFYLEMFKGTISEIHDRTYIFASQIKYNPYYIPYEKHELEINKVINNYIFRLAKNSEELKTIGNKMKICVGSYDGRAFSKRCNIILMLNKKTKEPEMCIEINGNSLIQAKDYCNKYASEEKRTSLLLFLETNKLNYQECSDVTFFRDNEYHNLIKEDLKKPIQVFEYTDERDYQIFEKGNPVEKVFLNKNNLFEKYKLKEYKQITQRDDEFDIFF